MGQDEELKKKIALYYHNLVSLVTGLISIIVTRMFGLVVHPYAVKELFKAD